MGKCRQTRKHKCTFKISICSSQCNYSKKSQQVYRFVSFAQNTDVHMSGKTAKLHDWQKMRKQLLLLWTTLYLFTRIVIIFQQQLGFYIETKGSVKFFWWIGNIIRSSDDSKCQACMRENDADESWQACLGKLWFSRQRRRDERGGSNARHSRKVTALHRKSRGLGDACARKSLWWRDLRFGRWCFNSGDTKTEAQHLYALP